MTEEFAGSIGTSRIGPLPREEERLAWIENFEKTWKAPSLLRPHHKLAIKIYTSLKQGRDGRTLLCYFCNTLFPTEQPQIHHLDHDRTNNQLSNIPPTCEPCNNDEKARWMSETRRGTYAATATVITPKEKENAIETESNSIKSRQFHEAPPTYRKSKEYKVKILAYMIEYVKDDRRTFEEVVTDGEALAGCSHDKAVEYVTGFSKSVFAPFESEWTVQDINGNFKLVQGIRPRKNWDAEKYATEEYKLALELVKAKKAGEAREK